MGHADRFVLLRSQKRGLQRDIADVAASDVQLCQLVDVDVIQRRALRKNAPPDLRALAGVRERKLHDEAETPQRRRIERGLEIARQYRQALILFNALE